MKNNKRAARKHLRWLSNNNQIEIEYDTAKRQISQPLEFEDEFLKGLGEIKAEEYWDEINLNDWFNGDDYNNNPGNVEKRVHPLRSISSNSSLIIIKLKDDFISDEGKKELQKDWIQYTWEDYKYRISAGLGIVVFLGNIERAITNLWTFWNWTSAIFTLIWNWLIL